MFDVPHRRFDSLNRISDTAFRRYSSGSGILHFPFSISRGKAPVAWTSPEHVEAAAKNKKRRQRRLTTSALAERVF